MFNKTKISIATLLATNILYASTAFATQTVNIPDIKFHSCLNSYLQQPTQSDITDTQLASLTGQISCDERGIQDITGAEYLVNIDYLNLDYNQLVSVTPLANLMNLLKISLAGNHITTGSPLKELLNLQNLDMNNNSLTSGDFISSMSHLVSLNLSTNMINTLPVIEGLTELQYLNLQGCNILDISNLSDLTQIQQLTISDNHIANMSPISAMDKLYSLDMTRQTIQLNPIKNTDAIIINNPVIDINGSLVPPSTISNGGTYQDGKITWNDVPQGTGSVGFEFSQTINFNGLDVLLEGSVTQYLE